MYDSQLKSDVIRREIRKKSRILTRNSTGNDSIVCQVKGSSCCDFEDEFHHSRSDFSLFSPRNLTFKPSLDAKIDQEEDENKRFKD